ncbi:MAG: hypothetical protein LJE69_00220 [Thiohalocapsa sp.]|uniref:hypothetical protein n=1 Tax=Thiohalocapsa sp. TaxID=2497641 RepID=UPI0025D40D60|nr:hypothetical protein [Thiohalocapsa sp.]MCG6939662.1 hypothetical protein [Thiohalocapsa sp.]
MVEAALERRVDTLEDYMKELSYQSMRTEMELARLAREMREFKDEMREFKDEMREFKDETERDRKRMNKQWGELANRLGTLAEDIVAPNLPRIARELFDCTTPELVGVRLARHVADATFEVDVLVVCPRVVLLNETKSRLKSEHLDELLAKVAAFPEFYPEYRRERVIGVAASLSVDGSLIRRATHLGLLVMGMGDETMEVLNPEVVERPGGVAPGGG